MTKGPIITKTSVTCSQSRTINMGNYENVNVFVSTTFESVEAGSEEALYDKALAFVESKVDERAAAISKGSLNKVTKNKSEAKKEEKTDEKVETKTKAKASKAAKPKAKKQVEEEDESEVVEIDESDLTLDHVRQALRDYAKEHGKLAAKELMQQVAKAKKMDDIPEDKFSAVILACEEEPEGEELSVGQTKP
jgi:archaellum component FlaD/FlaE